MPYAGDTERATRLNEAKRGGIGRLAADGTTDPTFMSPFGPASAITGIEAQPDGKILVGGTFTLVDSHDVLDLARVDANGALDPTFAPPRDGVQFGVFAIQPDGKIVAYERKSREGYLVRLTADGTIDSTFSVDFGDNAGVDRMIVQPDGRIIVTGTFAGVGGQRGRIGRFNTDGSPDTTFDPGAGPDDRVRALVLQPDGRVLIGGWFHNVNGTPRPCLARLSANGSLDATFIPLSPATAFGGSHGIHLEVQNREPKNVERRLDVSGALFHVANRPSKLGAVAPDDPKRRPNLAGRAVGVCSE